MARTPAVAGTFYPADKDDLLQMIAGLSPPVPPTPKRDALAVISPHAGYIYSGGVAGQTFAAVNIPADVIILGPNHHGRGAPLSLSGVDSWQMVMAEVPVNRHLCQLVLQHNHQITVDDEAHRPEHSLEVQIPFLLYHQPALTITPLVVATLSCQECLATGLALAEAIREFDRPVLLVASTDMSHYESRSAATLKDHQALARITDLDPRGLYETVIGKGITMCGIMPTTIVLAAAMALGAGKAELLCYTDSGATSGDLAQVVGYAGMVIS